jgi:hypothetical protein
LEFTRLAEAAGEKLIAWLAQTSEYHITLFGYSLPLSDLLLCNSVPVHWNYIQIVFVQKLACKKLPPDTSIAMRFIRVALSLLIAVRLHL